MISVPRAILPAHRLPLCYRYSICVWSQRLYILQQSLPIGTALQLPVITLSVNMLIRCLLNVSDYTVQPHQPFVYDMCSALWCTDLSSDLVIPQANLNMEVNNSKEISKDYDAHTEMGHVCFPRAMTKPFHQGRSQLQSRSCMFLRMEDFSSIGERSWESPLPLI